MQKQIGNEFKSVPWELLTSSITYKGVWSFPFFWDQLLVIMEQWTKLGWKQKKLHGIFTFTGFSVIKDDHNMQD